jgi:hypothetical protein
MKTMNACFILRLLGLFTVMSCQPVQKLSEPKKEGDLLGRKQTNFLLKENDEVKLINSAIKQNYMIHVTGDIVKFDSLCIGKGEKKYLSGQFILTKDSVIYYKTLKSTTRTAYKHHLPLRNRLDIAIERKLNSTDVTIINEKDTFRIASDFTGMNSPFIRSFGSEIKVRKFEFTCNDYQDDVFIFGDSYVNCAASARWPFYIYNSGYQFFCDGLPGGRSEDSYDFLKSAFSVHKPKYAIWCLGMNDGSDTPEAPSAKWKDYLQKVMAMCKENKITLILATVPSVPARNNAQKNRFVRASGYRYIDFEKAVSDGSGKLKEGMLAEDEVHPTDKGAKALADEFVRSFPEIKESMRR